MGNAHMICRRRKHSTKKQQVVPTNSATGNVFHDLHSFNNVFQWQRVGVNIPRSGHGVSVHSGKAYIFGGCTRANGERPPNDVGVECIDSMVAVDLETMECLSIHRKGSTPGPRASFAMCEGPLDGTIIVAGGAGPNGVMYSDILEFHVNTKKWRTIAQNAIFCKCYGQSVRPYQSSLIFFGGTTGNKYSNEVYKFDVNSGDWKRLETTGNRPSPRYKQEMVIIGHKMYIIGGGNFKPKSNHMDIFCLDLKSLNWTEVHTCGKVPFARVAHTCAYDHEEHKVYVWGGVSTTMDHLAECFVLDMKSMVWSVIVPETSIKPGPRAFHSASFHNGSLFIFGGTDLAAHHYSDIWRCRARCSPPPLRLLAAKALQSRNKKSKTNFDNTMLPEDLVELVNDLNNEV